MKKIAFLLGCMLFYQPAGAVELAGSTFYVDNYRFDFGMHVTDLPPDGVSINLYTDDLCIILPPSHERF